MLKKAEICSTSNSSSSNSSSKIIELLKKCSESRDISQGRRLHEELLKNSSGKLNSSQDHSAAGSWLVRMYGRCGSVHEAEKIFDSLPVRISSSWNHMFLAYFENDLPRRALELGMKMDLEGVRRSKYNLVSSVSACARLGTKFVSEGRKLHQRIVQTGVELDEVVGSALVSMYGKCGSLEEAREVFDSVENKKMAFWTALVSAHTQNGQPRQALELYKSFISSSPEEPPDEVMLLSALSACSSVGSLEDGKLVHDQARSRGLDSRTRLGNALVDMYGRCLQVDEARRVFDGIQTKTHVSWNSIISAFAQEGDRTGALKLYREMALKGFRPNGITFMHVLHACEGSGVDAREDALEIHRQIRLAGLESDSFLASALVKLYGRCGLISEAREVFDRAGDRSTVFITTMVSAYAQNGYGDRALELYKQMSKHGMKPDRVTYLCALDACSSAGALEEGRVIHEKLNSQGIQLDVSLGTALVNFYGRCGALEACKQVFDSIPERNTMAWNSLLGSYSQWGRAKEALILYRSMNSEPNGMTYLAILGACSTLGALLQGRGAHSRLSLAGFDRDAHIGIALINMYGKCGSVEEARSSFERLQRRTVITWTTILLAYQHNGFPNKAWRCFMEMELDGVRPDYVSLTAVLVSCGHAGKLTEGRNYFRYMLEDYGVEPMLVHYHGLVDLLCRTGWIVRAEEVIDNMPFEPNAVTWTTLLTACRTFSTSFSISQRAADEICKLEPGNPAVYFVLASMYSGVRSYSQEMDRVTEKLQSMVRLSGRSFIEVRSEIHEVTEGRIDDHPWKDAIDEELNRLNIELTVERGCKIEEHNHSAKRAVVLGLISTLPETTIRVVKNLKLCADCHHAIKFFAKIRKRRVVVRDYCEFHHIDEQGSCSCDKRRPLLQGLALDSIVPPRSEIPGTLY